jgi:tRNA(Ser,Leu) C12 N-acetylase TAN1
MSTAEANDTSRTDRKRKSSALRPDGGTSYHNYKQSHTNNPRRGGPGILFTCETGREFKARREGLEILQQDWELSSISRRDLRRNDRSAFPSERGTGEATKSTLEEELVKLRNERFKAQSSSLDSPFALYETGCKGVVVVLFQEPRGKTSARTSSATNDSRKINDDEGAEIIAPNIGVADGQMDGGRDVSSDSDHLRSLWDPVLAVHRIARDMTEKAPVYTNSRFITRMIPIQITCYATIDDIVTAVHTLLQPIVQSPSTAPAQSHKFAIHEKRRFCSQIKREPLISAVGNMVGQVTKEKPWTVQLTDPDFTIWIEICKTLAGISILPAKYLHPRNFNMVEWRLSLDPNCGSANAEDNERSSTSAANTASVGLPTSNVR